MAIFNNVTVKADDWYDINTLSGAPVGGAFLLQNISSGNCILKEAATKPSNDNGPILYNTSMGDLSKATVASGSDKIWAKVVGSPSTVILAVYE